MSEAVARLATEEEKQILARWEGKSLRDILETECRDSLAVVADIRDKRGRDKDTVSEDTLRLKAASLAPEKFFSPHVTSLTLQQTNFILSPVMARMLDKYQEDIVEGEEVAPEST